MDGKLLMFVIYWFHCIIMQYCLSLILPATLICEMESFSAHALLLYKLLSRVGTAKNAVFIAAVNFPPHLRWVFILSHASAQTCFVPRLHIPRQLHRRLSIKLSGIYSVWDSSCQRPRPGEGGGGSGCLSRQ